MAEFLDQKLSAQAATPRLQSAGVALFGAIVVKSFSAENDLRPQLKLSGDAALLVARIAA